MSEQQKAHVYAWEDYRAAQHSAFAHQEAIRVATKAADPIYNPRAFHMVYWTVMGGYGFRPYIPGVSW